MGVDSKAQVLQATDIAALIGGSVALQRRGKSFVGLCPFHQEKTPSFHVHPAKQFFYCFGCKAHGNAIDFVMKRDRLEFKEALEVLARAAGIELPKYGGSGPKAGEKQALVEANSAACSLFGNLLSHPQDGQAARDYLAKRGFSAESISRWQIGFAPAGWDNLLRSAVGRKFSPQVLLQAGLIKARDNDRGGGFYDTFRNRIMFPIRDEAGRIIAFGGRVMPGSEDPAKYLNSPETPLFSKGRCIFGIDLARQRIVETRTAVVVEGYLDVIGTHQFGFTNVVSVLGTAMTEQHITVLRRFADRIVLLFDADSAGDAAVARTVQLFLTQPVEIAVASMPEGVDPDEFLLSHGSGAFDELLSNATDALSYAWKQLVRQFAASGDLTGQQKAAAQYLELLAGARGSGPIDPMRWGAALTRVSRLTEIPVEDLHRRFKGHKPPGSAGIAARKAEEAQVAEQGEPTNVSPPLPDAPPMDGAQRWAERWLLGALLVEPRHWAEVQRHVTTDDFADPANRRLAEAYWSHQRDEGEPVFSEFLGGLDELLGQLAVELVGEVEQLENVQATVNAALGHWAGVRRMREERKIVADLRRAGEEKTGTTDEADLLRQLQEKARQPDLRRAGK